MSCAIAPTACIAAANESEGKHHLLVMSARTVVALDLRLPVSLLLSFSPSCFRVRRCIRPWLTLACFYLTSFFLCPLCLSSDVPLRVHLSLSLARAPPTLVSLPQDTEGMRSILEERTRRKDKKRPGSSNINRDKDGLAAGGANGSHGSDTTAASSSSHGGKGSAANTGSGGDGTNGNKKGDLSLLVNKLKTRGLASNGVKGGGAVAPGVRSNGAAQLGESGGGGDGSNEGGGDGSGRGRRGKKKRRKA